LGASNGALHTTWRNSGAGVSGAAVDIGDPRSEGEMVDGSSAGIGREMGSAGSARSGGGTWVRSVGCALVREEWECMGLDEDGLAAECSRRG